MFCCCCCCCCCCWLSCVVFIQSERLSETSAWTQMKWSWTTSSLSIYLSVQTFIFSRLQNKLFGVQNNVINSDNSHHYFNLCRIQAGKKPYKCYWTKQDSLKKKKSSWNEWIQCLKVSDWLRCCDCASEKNCSIRNDQNTSEDSRAACFFRWFVFLQPYADFFQPCQRPCYTVMIITEQKITCFLLNCSLKL